MDVNTLRAPSRSARVLNVPGNGEKSPYPPDILPGAVDVNSPYGTIRLYEWGSEDGRKVLFIHGLSTPAPALGVVADTLAQRGCRVMVLDLWGRGYSDSPSDLNHDSRLYTTQILLAISTSPISWTGIASGGFSLVGYSMGGGVVVSFAGYFPQLINSIVLMAPPLRESLPSEYRAWPLRYSWLFPLPYIKWFMRRLLIGPTDEVMQDETTSEGSNFSPGPKDSTSKLPYVAVTPKSLIDVPGIVNWEIDHSDAFIYSVTSSLRHGPIENQHSAWRLLRSLIEGKEEHTRSSSLPNRLLHTKVLLLLGEKDSILPKDEVSVVAQDLLGVENLEIVSFEEGHGFPITQGVEVAKSICDFWKLSSS